jgi:uncharacterized protein YegJ (DUF2314 family)
MTRYIFSNGKITVEEGMYQSAIQDKKKQNQSVVLLITAVASPVTDTETTATDPTNVDRNALAEHTSEQKSHTIAVETSRNQDKFPRSQDEQDHATD